MVWRFCDGEPGQTGTLAFVYTLSPEITNQAVLGKYDLLVQKQIGTIAPELTLDLDFGKKLQTAVPDEAPGRAGDNKYILATDLRQDKLFKLEFER